MVAGQTGLALFVPTEPGEYTFYCVIRGHTNLEAGILTVFHFHWPRQTNHWLASVHAARPGRAYNHNAL